MLGWRPSTPRSRAWAGLYTDHPGIVRTNVPQSASAEDDQDKKNAPRMRGVLSTTFAGDQPW